MRPLKEWDSRSQDQNIHIYIYISHPKVITGYWCYDKECGKKRSSSFQWVTWDSLKLGNLVYDYQKHRKITEHGIYIPMPIFWQNLNIQQFTSDINYPEVASNNTSWITCNILKFWYYTEFVSDPTSWESQCPLKVFPYFRHQPQVGSLRYTSLLGLTINSGVPWPCSSLMC